MSGDTLFEAPAGGADLWDAVATSDKELWRSTLAGWRVRPSQHVREWSLYLFALGRDTDLVVGPLTYWSLMHDFKLPMVSMRSRGMLELQRDRRKHR